MKDAKNAHLKPFVGLVTPKQVAYLESLGVPTSTSRGWSKHRASETIAKLLASIQKRHARTR
jgi:hypothetical protein